MRTLTKELQDQITPDMAIDLLMKGNERFVTNLKVNRNLLKQINETLDSQHPIAVIISCMDSRTSAELIFDQGLGDIFSVRVAGNVINEEIIGSTEFGCKLEGAKVVIVLGHTNCGAIKGAVEDIKLGHLDCITHKIQRCIPKLKAENKNMTVEDLFHQATRENVHLGISDLTSRSAILAEMVEKQEIKIIGGVHNISTGVVEFFHI